MRDRTALKLLKFLMIVSLLTFVWGVVDLAVFCQRADSKNWPTVTGVVTTSALKLDFHKPPHAPYYRPFVSYSYTVDGIPRGNTTITFNFDSAPRFPKEEGLKWLLEKYPVGKQIPVFYDRANPDTAVLKPGAEDWMWMAFAQIGGGILTCVAFWILDQRAKQRLLSSGGIPQSRYKSVA